MSDQYVFELQFKGKVHGSDCKENQFVIIDGSSMADFARLKEDLGMCMADPFKIQYIDDEDDIISIDTEDEFQEFAKLAKKRSSRGMLMRLILNCNPNNLEELLKSYSTLPEMMFAPSASAGLALADNQNQNQCTHFNEWAINHPDREQMKEQLKKEILKDLKKVILGEQANACEDCCDGSATGKSKAEQVEGAKDDSKRKEAYEGDSDGNVFLVPKKTKVTQTHKKLEKKEKLIEAKIDQRLEKLEMKRRKLVEKYIQHKMWIPKPASETKYSIPVIVSAIATKGSKLRKLVSAGKVFTHTWTIVNDGTVTLNNAELRHTWSSPGLEPRDTSLKLPPMMPGQNFDVVVRFKAPTYGQQGAQNFISYWHFFQLVDAHWHQFGHYVSLTGSLKRNSVEVEQGSDIGTWGALMNEPNKKPKKEEKKVVSFLEAVDAATAVKEAPQKEIKVLNKEELVSNIKLKKQLASWNLEASLASSEIAAEMAREAARLLARASENTSPAHAALKPSEGDKLNSYGLDEAAAGVRQLNLVDSESDSDTNMELDKDFIMVNITPEQSSDEKSKCETKEDDKTVPLADNNTPTAESESDVKIFPKLVPNVQQPLIPQVHPPVWSQSMAPLNLYKIPSVPTQNTSSSGFVFPPPVNYSQIPTYSPIPPFHHPHMNLPVAAQHPYVPFPQPLPLPPKPYFNFPPTLNPFSTLPTSNVIQTPDSNGTNCNASNATTAPINKPVETEAPSQVNPTKDSVPNTLNEEKTQSEQQQPEQESQQEQEQQQPLQQPQERPQTLGQGMADIGQGIAEQVQILPQALVDGAINVAATAYSTAWNALNNLRPKEGEASEFDPVFENNMAMLVEMGFINLERNARLLKRYNNDISQVIGIICSTGGSHNLDID